MYITCTTLTEQISTFIVIIEDVGLICENKCSSDSITTIEQICRWQPLHSITARICAYKWTLAGLECSLTANEMLIYFMCENNNINIYPMQDKANYHIDFDTQQQQKKYTNNREQIGLVGLDVKWVF